MPVPALLVPCLVCGQEEQVQLSTKLSTCLFMQKVGILWHAGRPFANMLIFFHIKTAQMGVGEGKSIGEWFGPNTVAQVLK